MEPIKASVLAVNAAKKLAVVLGPVALKEVKNYLLGNHGSKVKMGDYADCKIARFGDTACIVVDSNGGEVVLLDRDNVESYSFIKEKKRMVGLKYKTYFYYNIKFKNGQKSYIRISRKNRTAFLQHM